MKTTSDKCVTALIIQCNTNYARKLLHFEKTPAEPDLRNAVRKQASKKFTRVSEGKRLQREILNECVCH